MDRKAENYDKSYSDGFEGVTFDSDGGVIGSTTESSRAANDVAEWTEDHKQYNLRDGFGGSDFQGVDPLGPEAHGFGLDIEPESGYQGKPDGEPFPNRR